MSSFSNDVVLITADEHVVLAPAVAERVAGSVERSGERDLDKLIASVSEDLPVAKGTRITYGKMIKPRCNLTCKPSKLEVFEAICDLDASTVLKCLEDFQGAGIAIKRCSKHGGIYSWQTVIGKATKAISLWIGGIGKKAPLAVTPVDALYSCVVAVGSQWASKYPGTKECASGKDLINGSEHTPMSKDLAIASKIFELCTARDQIVQNIQGAKDAAAAISYTAREHDAAGRSLLEHGSAGGAVVNLFGNGNSRRQEAQATPDRKRKAGSTTPPQSGSAFNTMILTMGTKNEASANLKKKKADVLEAAAARADKNAAHKRDLETKKAEHQMALERETATASKTAAASVGVVTAMQAQVSLRTMFKEMGNEEGVKLATNKISELMKEMYG